jgi:hypothetical protein
MTKANVPTSTAPFTHEDYIRAVVQAVLDYPDLCEADREKIEAIKLVYGAGARHTRGVTYFQRWQKPGEGVAPVPLVEICAFGQQSWLQVAATTIHELGHVCAGMEAGHSKDWKFACERLGLVGIKAAGTEYTEDNFDPVLLRAIKAIPEPTDGKPCSYGALGVTRKTTGSCTLGFGVMGGKSRGPGSGSRLRLYECECVPPVKIRAAKDDLNCTCGICNARFVRPDGEAPAIGGSDED